jgi:hypothetical protein
MNRADIVTRSLTGELSRWSLAKLPAQELAGAAERYIPCLPLRFDEATGGLVEQDPACDVPVGSAR